MQIWRALGWDFDPLIPAPLPAASAPSGHRSTKSLSLGVL
jgi:hypothetical protein